MSTVIQKKNQCTKIYNNRHFKAVPRVHKVNDFVHLGRYVRPSLPLIHLQILFALLQNLQVDFGAPIANGKKQFPKLKIYVILKISSKRGVVTKLRINNRFCSTKSGSKTSRCFCSAKKQDLLLRILMYFCASDFLAKGLFFYN